MIVAPVDSKAARYAVEHWHYSQTMPVGRSTYFGVWEGDAVDSYRGVVIFGRGASPYLGNQFGLTVMQICELTRVALRSHVAPVSQIVSEAVRQLRALNQGLRIIVSFADPYHDHHGGIYQAMNWLYLGETAPTDMWRAPDGKYWHARTVYAGGVDQVPNKLLHARSVIRAGRQGRMLHNRMVSRTGTVTQFGRKTTTYKIDDCEPIKMPGKHRYVLPLDRGMRRQLLPLVQPYPKKESEAWSTLVGDRIEHEEEVPDRE